MGVPPRDDDGCVLPHDDHIAIPDDAYLVRYVHKDQLPPSDKGRRCLSSAAFSESSRERDRYQAMSVDILAKLQADDVDPRTRFRPGHVGAVLIQAGSLRQLGLQIGPDPMRSNDRYHAGVWGVKSSLRKRIKKCCCRWLVQPTNTLPIEEC